MQVDEVVRFYDGSDAASKRLVPIE